MLLTCRHCGAPIPAARGLPEGFCCAGCAYVYGLIQDGGLERYYRIKDPVTAPADASVFQPRDFSWVAEAQRRAESAGRLALDFSIQGLSCAGCIWLIERLFAQQPGAGEILVNAQLGSLHLTGERGVFDAAAWARRLQSFGYLLGPPAAAAAGGSDGLVGRIGLCAVCALNVMLFALPAYFGMRPDEDYARLFGLLSLLFASLSVLVGGSYFFRRAFAALRLGAMHIDLPIALGIAGAYAGSLAGWWLGRRPLLYFDFVATFILLMLVGRWAQTRALEGNRRRLLQLQPLPPGVRLATGEEIPRESLAAGQDYCLRSGETVPVRSELVSAAADFSLASISGEAAPRVFSAGGVIPAGAENLSRATVTLSAREPWSQSLLASLLAPASRPPASHPWLDRVIRIYAAVIVAGAALTAAAWVLLAHDWDRAFCAALAVLVVSCPCAIGLALPLADELATAQLRRRGVYVRESDLWSRLGRVRQIAFDKTGTLTFETPVLLNPESVAALAPPERAALAALVQGERHPVGQALWERLMLEKTVPAAAIETSETVGAGLAQGPWTLGKAGWRDDGPADGATVFAHAGRALARFRFADAPRPGAAEEMRRLQGAGYGIAILSGDDPARVAGLARALGLPESAARGALSPEAKAAWLRGHSGHETLMLGDGANDSLAFNAALCRGTPVVHRGLLEERADFYLLRQGIEGVRELLETARRRARCERWLVGFALAYNGAALAFAAAGRVGPWTAALLMPASSLASIALVTIAMKLPTVGHRRGVVHSPLSAGAPVPV